MVMVMMIVMMMVTGQLVCRVTFLVSLALHPATPLWLGECGRALGMESGAIPDTAVTSSSSHDHIVGPHNARVRQERDGGAWCAKTPVSSHSREYLEIALAAPHILTSTGTQGRFGNGKGLEYTEAYMLEYWRPGLPAFTRYTPTSGNQTFPGNINTYLEQKNELRPPLTATKIRFIPVSSHPRTVCLRVELYGCLETGGVVSYSVVDGTGRGGSGIKLRDDTYDGARGSGPLRHGLGQLYDGQLGAPLHSLHQQEGGRGQGWSWVGWSSEQLQQQPLPLTFTFDTMRNFSSVTLHTLADPGLQFVLPSKMEVYFSDDGANYHEKPLVSPSSWPPKLAPGAHNLSLALAHRPARVIKLLVHFPGPWLALSELFFLSEPCICNLSDWTDGQTSAPAEHTAGQEEDERDVLAVSSAHAQIRAFLAVVVGVSASVVVVAGAGLTLLVRRLRQHKHESPHVLKSPPSDSTCNLRLAPSFSGASSSGGNTLYGPMAAPGDEGSLYHQPYSAPLFSASQYSVATLSREATLSRDTIGRSATLGKNGSATPAPYTNLSGLVGGDYALPVLSPLHQPSRHPPFSTTSASNFTDGDNTAGSLLLGRGTTTLYSTTAPFSGAPTPPSTLPPSNLPSLTRLGGALPPPPTLPPSIIPQGVGVGVGVGVVGGWGQGRGGIRTSLKPRTSRKHYHRTLNRLPESDYGTVPWARRRSGVKLATSGTVADMMTQPLSRLHQPSPSPSVQEEAVAYNGGDRREWWPPRRSLSQDTAPEIEA